MEIKDTLFTPYVEVTTLLKVYKTEKGKEDKSLLNESIQARSKIK